MKTIWKFELSQAGGWALNNIRMPKSAQIIDVGMQGRSLCLWAIVEPHVSPVNREISVYGTGHQLGDDVEYIGTVHDGPFVWHVFDGGENPAT